MLNAKFKVKDLCFRSVSSVFSVLVFLSLSFCLSDDDDDTKPELHKNGLATVATVATFEGKIVSMIHESKKGLMRI